MPLIHEGRDDELMLQENSPGCVLDTNVVVSLLSDSMQDCPSAILHEFQIQGP